MVDIDYIIGIVMLLRTHGTWKNTCTPASAATGTGFIASHSVESLVIGYANIHIRSNSIFGFADDIFPD